MGACVPFSLTTSKLLVALIFIQVSDGLNLGLIAGDLKRFGSPLVIKKFSKLSPVFININSGPSVPKLPSKPPPLKIPEPKRPSRKVPRSILPPPLLLPPLIPKLPLLPILPIFPPILPPMLPPLAFLLPGLPLLPVLPPLLPKLKKPLKPLKVPILKRSPIKALETELKTVKDPLITLDKNKGILEKLLDLKKKGSLTTAEYLRFKKLLIK